MVLVQVAPPRRRRRAVDRVELAHELRRDDVPDGLRRLARAGTRVRKGAVVVVRGVVVGAAQRVLDVVALPVHDVVVGARRRLAAARRRLGRALVLADVFVRALVVGPARAARQVRRRAVDVRAGALEREAPLRGVPGARALGKLAAREVAREVGRVVEVVLAPELGRVRAVRAQAPRDLGVVREGRQVERRARRVHRRQQAQGARGAGPADAAREALAADQLLGDGLDGPRRAVPGLLIAAARARGHVGADVARRAVPAAAAAAPRRLRVRRGGARRVVQAAPLVLAVAAADARRAVVLLDELAALGAADEGEERRVVRARRRRLVDVDAGL